MNDTGQTLMRAILLIAVTSIPATLACCCGGGIPVATTTTPTTATQKQSSGNPTRKKVSRADFGNKWPLTVESGEVECISNMYLVFHHNGQTYALNGTAKERGYKLIDPIWKDNPKIKGTKIDIGPLIQEARNQCGPGF